MSLIQNLTDVNTRLLKLGDRFGIPQYQNVVIDYNGVQTLLDPRPRVDSMDMAKPANEYLINQVKVTPEDLWISGIPRAYPEVMIARGIWIIQATSDGTIWTGTTAQAVFIDRSDIFTWKVLVQKRRSR